MRLRLSRMAVIGATMLALAACGPQPPEPPAAPETPEAPVAPHAPTPAAEVSCRQEIGEAASAALVKRCIAVSPATRPPCNAANPCDLIRDEIVRACSLFENQTPMRECRP